MTLSDNQRLILNQAAEHPGGIALPPARLPPAPRAAVARALLRAGLLADREAGDADPSYTWKLDGKAMVLAITDGGRQVVSLHAHTMPVQPSGESQEPLAAGEVEGHPFAPQGADEASTAPHGAPLQPPLTKAEGAAQTTSQPTSRRGDLHGAAQALLAAWEAGTALEAPLAALRAALAKPARVGRDRTAQRQPRSGTKQQAVLALLRRPEGASVAQITEATGWQAHTVRGLFAGLRKRQGIEVSVLERVRQVGPGKEGAKGSYSIYRIAEAG